MLGAGVSVEPGLQQGCEEEKLRSNAWVLLNVDFGSLKAGRDSEPQEEGAGYLGPLVRLVHACISG